METSRDKEIRMTPSMRREIIKIVDERIREAHVTREDFTELKNIVKELAEAQRNSEQRLTRLEIAVNELAEAQRNSEQRLTRLEIAVNELAEAQKRTEQRVEELAEAQRNSEQRLTRLEIAVNELAEAQKRTEQRVEELAQAQKRTEEELRKLIEEHSKTREQLGGLSITVGYILENEAMRALPTLLEEEFGLKVEGRLVRKFLTDINGNPMEVNIFGEAIKDGERFLIVGESKSQLSTGGVDEFIRKKLDRLSKPEGIGLFPILVTHMITAPDVVNYALSKGIRRVYYSYEFGK